MNKSGTAVRMNETNGYNEEALQWLTDLEKVKAMPYFSQVNFLEEYNSAQEYGKISYMTLRNWINGIAYPTNMAEAYAALERYETFLIEYLAKNDKLVENLEKLVELGYHKTDIAQFVLQRNSTNNSDLLCFYTRTGRVRHNIDEMISITEKLLTVGPFAELVVRCHRGIYRGLPTNVDVFMEHVKNDELLIELKTFGMPTPHMTVRNIIKSLRKDYYKTDAEIVNAAGTNPMFIGIPERMSYISVVRLRAYYEKVEQGLD